MPEELFPSSYLRDCGHQSDFFENTIQEAKAQSHRRMIHLGDSEPNEHTIVFYKGQMIDILCFLYQSGAGSLGYGAEQVGLCVRVLMEEARKRGVQPNTTSISWIRI